MFEPRDIVAQPNGCVLLNAGIARTRQYEGAFIRTSFTQPFERSSRHLLTVGTADLEMPNGFSTDFLQEQLLSVGWQFTEFGIEWALIAEQRWFVHIVPDSSDATGKKNPELSTPPGTHALLHEIWQTGGAWPNLTNEGGTIQFGAEGAKLSTFPEGCVSVRAFHARVNDGYDSKPILREIAQHCLESRKPCLAHGKDSVVLHVVDVEHDRIARNLSLSVLAHYVAGGAFRWVAPPALLMT
jgi:hypothetical protein